MRAATELVAEVGDRFKVGDPAVEHTARLAALVTAMERDLARTGSVPEDLRAEIAELLVLVRATMLTGGRWLEAVADGPELANCHMRARVQKLYGPPIRDDSSP